MPTQRLSMRRIRQLLALHFGAGASTRAIGLGIAPSTVREYLGRAAAAGVCWPLAADVTDESLVARLFINAGVRAGARHHAEPDWPALVHELQRPGGQPPDPVGRVPGDPPERLRSRPVLPAVPQVRATAVADDASTRRGRAEGFRGLLRQARGDRRSAHRRSAHGGDLRRRARRLQPDLRRGELDADVAGLDRGPRAQVLLLRRRAAPAGARQSQERHPKAVASTTPRPTPGGPSQVPTSRSRQQAPQSSSKGLYSLVGRKPGKATAKSLVLVSPPSNHR